MNRSIKRKSKKIALDKEQNIKKDAKGARNAMINSEIDKIRGYSEDGFVDRKCLEELVQKATDPYQYQSGEFTTIINCNEVTTASVLSLHAVDNVLRDKRKADELSRLDAKRRKMKVGKKCRRTPNTTRGADEFEVINRLYQHDSKIDKLWPTQRMVLLIGSVLRNLFKRQQNLTSVHMVDSPLLLIVTK